MKWLTQTGCLAQSCPRGRLQKRRGTYLLNCPETEDFPCLQLGAIQADMSRIDATAVAKARIAEEAERRTGFLDLSDSGAGRAAKGASQPDRPAAPRSSPHHGSNDLFAAVGVQRPAITSVSPDTQVSDLGPLTGLTALQSLHLRRDPGPAILWPLAGLTALESLDLLLSQVSDLGAAGGPDGPAIARPALITQVERSGARWRA